MPPKKKRQRTITFNCIPITQGSHTLALFAASVKTLWEITTINQRDSDKDKGYQRVLSGGRVDSIVRYVQRNNPIPNSVLVTFDAAKFNRDKTQLIVPKKSQAGWIIDGQHRLAGIHKSGIDMQIAVIAFLGLDIKEQIQQFIRINKEAKNVPSSLYIDLLKHLPDKSDTEIAKERAADIANELRKDENSPFYGKIVMIGNPKAGELSLTNFARKIAPLVQRNKGKLGIYSITTQIGIINNYYRALAHVFPDAYAPKEGVSIFFKTLGFGALMNALPVVFDLCLRDQKGFRVEDLIKILKRVDDFNFELWEQIGTGSQAEISAGEDLSSELLSRHQEGDAEEGLDLPLY